MLFTLTVTPHGAPEDQIVISEKSVVEGVRALLATASELAQPATLKAVLTRVEPFLPVLAEATGTGILGQIALQLAVTAAHRALNDTGGAETDNAPLSWTESQHGT